MIKNNSDFLFLFDAINTNQMEALTRIINHSMD